MSKAHTQKVRAAKIRPSQLTAVIFEIMRKLDPYYVECHGRGDKRKKGLSIMMYRAHTGVDLNLVNVGQVQAGGKGKGACLKNEPDIGLHLTSDI